MLSIQPNFSQRIYSTPSFGESSRRFNMQGEERYEDSFESDLAEDNFDKEIDNNRKSGRLNQPEAEIDEKPVVKKQDTMAVLSEDINQAMNDINYIKDKGEKVMPSWLKTGVNGLLALGTAAVAGISVRFGAFETSKIVGKLGANESIKTVITKGKKPFNSIVSWAGEGIKTIKGKESYINFMQNNRIGKFLSTCSTSFNESAEVKAVKRFYNGLNGEKVEKGIGNTLGVSTGVSTLAATGLEDKKDKSKNAT